MILVITIGRGKGHSGRGARALQRKRDPAFAGRVTTRTAAVERGGEWRARNARGCKTFTSPTNGEPPALPRRDRHPFSRSREPRRIPIHRPTRIGPRGDCVSPLLSIKQGNRLGRRLHCRCRRSIVVIIIIYIHIVRRR